MNGDATVHAELLAVEGHCPLNFALACALAGNRKRQRLRLGYPANGKRSGQFNGRRTGLHNLVGVKGGVGIILEVEEVFALQLAVVHAASAVLAKCAENFAEQSYALLRSC
jgi:hypothetical protein